MSNVVMMMAPRAKRARYVAAFQTVTFAAAFAGPLAGALAINTIGFRGVFLVSAVGRAAATLIVARLAIHDRERHG
jgi:MFS family permease